MGAKKASKSGEVDKKKSSPKPAAKAPSKPASKPSSKPNSKPGSKPNSKKRKKKTTKEETSRTSESKMEKTKTEKTRTEKSFTSQNSVSKSGNSEANCEVGKTTTTATTEEKTKQGSKTKMGSKQELQMMMAKPETKAIFGIKAEEKTKQGSKTVVQEKEKEKEKEKSEPSPPIADNEQPVIVGWLKEIFAKNVPDIGREYQPNNPPQFDPVLIVSSIANENENRYNNMPCLEKTRVKLPGVINDYIHANYVGTPENPKRYICTQGPLDCTIEKFWRMVVANGCEVIIMLCDFKESGDDKCARYFPDQSPSTMTCGPVTIKCYGQSVEEFPENKILTTLLEVTLAGEKPLTVRHSKFVGWPDHGVPANTEPLLKMVHRARHSRRGSVVIHCSAGIGRTGTCLLVAMAIDEMKKTGSGPFPGLWPLLQTIREQRAFAVQNNKQYVFAHLCLAERAAGVATKAGLNLEKFQNDYKQYMTGSTKMKKKRSVTSRTPVKTTGSPMAGTPVETPPAVSPRRPPST